MRHSERPDRSRLDFAFGPKPKDPTAEAGFRLAELRRTGAARDRDRLRPFSPKPDGERHARWGRGLARFGEA